MQRERGNMDTLLAAWAEGKVPAPPTKKRTRGGLILLACLAGAALLAFLLPVFVSMFGIFHPAALRGIRPGDTREQVVEALGEPDASYAGGLEYGGVHFWRVPGTGSYIDLYGRSLELADLVDFIARRWYVPHIAVELDSFDRVVSVTLDADRPKAGVQKHKRLTSVSLLQTEVPPFVETDLWYAAEYADGSYYMGPAVAGYRCDAYGSTQTVGWDDRFGNACTAQVKVVTESGNYAEGEGWHIAPDLTLHISSAEGAENFVMSAFDRAAIRSVSFDCDLQTLPGGLLADCISLERVGLPDSVTSIGDAAFSGCMSLAEIDLPDAVTSIGEGAFEGCYALRDVYLPQSLREIGLRAFANCAALEEIAIPGGVQEIGRYAFEYCSGLTSVALPSGLREIGDYAFRWCGSLEYVALPETVAEVGNYAFSLSGLRQVGFAEGLVTIGAYAFSGTPLASAQLPDSIRTVGEGVFASCSLLQEVRLPHGLAEIGASAFENCDSLAEIELPASLQYLGASAFANCDLLRSVALPGGIGTVGDCAFYDCASLESVVIGEGVTRIGSGAFAVCGSLRSVALPSTLERIESGAFSNSGDANYFSVTIPASVTYIGTRAFWQSWVSEAVFEQPEGWAAEDLWGESTLISTVDLSDPQTAARLLHTDLAEQIWQRG